MLNERFKKNVRCYTKFTPKKLYIIVYLKEEDILYHYNHFAVDQFQLAMYISFSCFEIHYLIFKENYSVGDRLHNFIF